MTARLAAFVVCVALAGAGVVSAAALGSSGAKASASAGARAAQSKCASKPRRVGRTCRRVRASAGFRRGAGRGRALLAPRSVRDGAGPIGVTGPTGGATGPPGTTPAPGGDPVGVPGDPPPVVTSTIGAEAYDFGTFVLRLTKTAVPAGDLTIYFRNYDVSDHNLWIEPPAGAGAPAQVSDAVGEYGGATKTVAVTTGTWRLYCSLPGHEAMTRDLAVQ